MKKLSALLVEILFLAVLCMAACATAQDQGNLNGNRKPDGRKAGNQPQPGKRGPEGNRKAQKTGHEWKNG